MLDHDGTIELESAPGEGTTVSCLFPSLQSAEDVLKPGELPLPRGAGQRVLFVDDERSLGVIAARGLRDLGYQPTVLTDSAEALEMFRRTPDAFDLLITDLSMPGFGGLDLARAVRDIRPDLPILLATGFVEDIPPDDLAASGISATARKPLTKRDLGEAVHWLLATRPSVA
jgi:CheY-like chemotaxis protein